MRLAVALALAAAALAAGCDRAIELHLVPPAGDAAFDTSCVTAVELTLTGRGLTEESYACVEVSPGQVRSLRDHGLDGAFDLPLPPWDIVGVQVRGVAAPEGCTSDIAVGPTVFVASSDLIDDDIALPLRGVLSCADKVDAPVPVRVVAMDALVADGSCAPPAGVQVQPGELFPSTLYGARAGWLLYYWTPLAPLSAEGFATAPYTFRAAATGSCLGLWIDDGSQGMAGCLTPPGRGACGPEAEFHYLPYGAVANASLTAEQQLSRSNVVFGVVLDRARAPIAGATVTVSGDAEVHYTEPRAAGFAPVAATATTARGTFTVLSNKPVLLEVTAPGKVARRVMAGGNGATVVVMDDGPT